MSENAPYVSLANKYRPQKFEDMIGQESISKTLQNALKLGRIAHAYLFYGPRGCGKTTTARIFAKALNCTGHGNGQPTGEPCGECPQCREIAQSSDMDVLELDAASNTGIDKVREAIIERVAYAPSRDRYKVFILDEVHMLSTSAFNALLKTIEEPPAHVIFILATTEKHKVPTTILSRCQAFRFRPITVDEITEHLLELAEAEGLNLTEKAARIIAKNAGGAMRDALTLLDRAVAYSDGKIDDKLVGEMLGLTPQDLLTQTITALIQKDSAVLHSTFETLRAEGFDANGFLKDIKNALGDLFYFSLGQGSAPFEGAEKITALASAGLLAALSRKINKLSEEVKFTDNALISAEVGLFTVMDSCFDVDGFIRRLEALERGESGSTEPPAVSFKPTPAASKKAAAPRVVQATAPQPAPAVSAPATAMAAPQETAVKITEDNALWEALVKAFKKSIFVYDALTNCSVRFNGDNWNIHFEKGKEFYKVPAGNKLAEIEKAAYQLSGRTIHFTITAYAPEQAVAQPAPAEKPTPAQTKAAAAKPAIISEEEPLVKGDFSAEVKNSAAEKPAQSAATPRGKGKKATKTTAGEVPEEVKNLAELFGGEIVN